MPLDVCPPLDYYYACLPSDRAAAGRELSAAIGAGLSDLPGTIAPAVFWAWQVSHPVTDSPGVIFWTAVEELLLATGEHPGEVPVLFAGFCARPRLRRTWHVGGLLLTDARILVRERPEARRRPAHSTWLSDASGASPADAAEAAVSDAWFHFPWTAVAHLMTAAEVSELRTVFVQATGLVLGRKAPPTGEAQDTISPTGGTRDTPDLRNNVEEVASGERVKEAVDRLALHVAGQDLGVLVITPRMPGRAERLAKLCAAAGVGRHETVLFAVTDTVLTGSLGLVVTDLTVRSKEPFSRPTVTPRDRIVAVGTSPDGKEITFGTDERHRPPMSPDPAQRRVLAQILAEFLLPDVGRAGVDGPGSGDRAGGRNRIENPSRFVEASQEEEPSRTQDEAGNPWPRPRDEHGGSRAGARDIRGEKKTRPRLDAPPRRRPT